MKNSEMAATGDEVMIKLEVEVKPEPVECVVCGNRSSQTTDVTSSTTASGTSLLHFFTRYTQQDIIAASTRQICKSCHDLVNLLEQAELEYLKLKETFEAIISNNPLFETISQNQLLTCLVKVEYDSDNYINVYDNNIESDEEPLSAIKKKNLRELVKSKKKVDSSAERTGRPKNDKSSCDKLGESGTGGAKQATAHMLTAQTEVITNLPPVPELKKENSIDGSESSHCNNGVDNSLPPEGSGADDSSDYLPSAGSDEDDKETKTKKKIMNKTRKKREPKAWHHCDQCDAKYTNIKSLEVHQEEHAGGKPPYICEVCGAWYKHKRTYEIHEALHKGVSDWKCEQCNKLFPSKTALARHTDIHTGKPNYQCDICGKSFIHTSSFKMHKRFHSGVKPHSCDVCGLALLTRSHLKRHMRVHTGEKRHECTLCGKRFSERRILAAHACTRGAPPQPRARLFRCAICAEGFVRRYMLERHMSVVHGTALEKAPPTPRNTTSKPLKVQAQPASLPDTHSLTPEVKEERSPESCAASAGPLQQEQPSDTGGAAAAWVEWRQRCAQ